MVLLRARGNSSPFYGGNMVHIIILELNTALSQKVMVKQLFINYYKFKGQAEDNKQLLTNTVRYLKEP